VPRNLQIYLGIATKFAPRERNRERARLSIPAWAAMKADLEGRVKSTVDSGVKISPMDPTPVKSMVPIPLHICEYRSGLTGAGDGGGFSSGGYSGGGDFQDRPSRTQQYEEYDEFDDGGARATAQRSSVPRRSTPKKETTVPSSSKKKEVDLFSFDDDLPSAPATTSAPVGASSIAAAGDDDFDDFQSATGPSTSTTSPPAATQISTPAITSLYNAPPPQPTAARPMPTATSSFSSFGVTSPLSQPSLSPNPQTAFGMNTTTSAPKPASTASFQPNYFSQTTSTPATPLVHPSSHIIRKLIW
jgi:hypothetical protein